MDIYTMRALIPFIYAIGIGFLCFLIAFMLAVKISPPLMVDDHGIEHYVMAFPQLMVAIIIGVLCSIVTLIVSKRMARKREGS